MILENQVTSLALSQRLKELGVKQESLFTWQQTTQGYRIKRYDYATRPGNTGTDRYSAFTVAELGEMLIATDHQIMPGFSSQANFKGWYRQMGKEMILEDTETDARAKILIYLIEKVRPQSPVQ